MHPQEEHFPQTLWWSKGKDGERFASMREKAEATLEEEKQAQPEVQPADPQTGAHRQ